MGAEQHLRRCHPIPVVIVVEVVDHLHVGRDRHPGSTGDGEQWPGDPAFDAVFAEPGGGATVVDWKTGERPRGAEAARQAAIQLGVYRLAVHGRGDNS